MYTDGNYCYVAAAIMVIFFSHDGSGTALPTQIRQLLQEDDFMISAQPVKPYFSPEMKTTLIAMSQNEDIISRSKVTRVNVITITFIIISLFYIL